MSNDIVTKAGQFIPVAMVKKIKVRPFTTIGHRIRHHRRNMGLTQDSLGGLIGVNNRVVCSYENDKLEVPFHRKKKLEFIFGKKL